MVLLMSCAGTSYVFGHWIYRDCLHSAHIWQDCCIKYSSMDRCKQDCSRFYILNEEYLVFIGYDTRSIYLLLISSELRETSLPMGRDPELDLDPPCMSSHHTHHLTTLE